MKLNVNRQTAKCKVLLKINNIHGRLQELTDIGGSTQRTSCLKIVKVYISPFTLQWRRYRGAGGAWAPPLFIQGGRAPPNYLTTGVPKLPYYWLGICTVRRESISKLSSSSRRGALPLFSSPRDESSRKRTPHEY